MFIQMLIKQNKEQGKSKPFKHNSLGNGFHNKRTTTHKNKEQSNESFFEPMNIAVINSGQNAIVFNKTPKNNLLT